METKEKEIQPAPTALNSKDRVEETPSTMASEIEQYLMSKFRERLDQNAKSRSKILLFSQFQEINTLLGSTPQADQLTKKKLYSLNDYLVECQMVSEKHYMFRSPEDLIAINSIRMKLKKIKKEMEDQRVASNGNIQQPTSGSSEGTRISNLPEETSPPPPPRANEFKVHGFDEDAITVEKLLLSQANEDGFNAIAIVGTKGIGKTTLSQMLFNRPDVKTHFLPRIWVSMSNDDDDDMDPKRAIVKRMLISLGIEKETMNMISEAHELRGLLFALHQQLLGKRYLIVLDDARDMDSWYEQLNSRLAGDGKWEERFGYGLPKGYGGTVIVSSRNEELARMMVGEKNLHRLLPLTDPKSCWAIFKDSVNDDTFNRPNEEDLKMVKQKCGGIPLAAKMMGENREILRKHDV